MTFEYDCDVYLEPVAGSGEWNMAVDAALLAGYLAGTRTALRLYEWAEPTLSIGHFQQDREDVPDELAQLPRVRRLSGGGAILHDRELTYSCVVPAGHPLARQPLQLYDAMHARIISLLAEFGVAARLRGAEQARPGGPFLCFARGDERDIVLGEHKIVGSAQRRRKGGVLQHGSLLLQRSPLAPEFPGINDLVASEQPVPRDELLRRLADELPRVLGVRFARADVAALMSTGESTPPR